MILFSKHLWQGVAVAVLLSGIAHAQVLTGLVQRQESRLVQELRTGRLPVQDFNARPRVTSDALIYKAQEELVLRSNNLSYVPLADDERPVRLQPKHRDDGYVVPPGVEAGEQGATLRLLAAQDKISSTLSKKSITALGASNPGACTGTVVRELENAQDTVQALAIQWTGMPHLAIPTPDERLYQYLKANKVTMESPAAVQALTQLETAWRSMLDKCFVSPSERGLFAAVSHRVGAFEALGGLPFCTGTLLGDGNILTARHCFFDDAGDLRAASILNLRFRTANGSSTLIPDIDALKKAPRQAMSPDTDWIVIKAPPGSTPLESLQATATLEQFDATLKNGIPTPLEIFSVVPLAKTLDPKRFPESIAGHGMAGCYAVQTTPSCFTNMCAAVGGGSGASIFSSSNGQPRWAGMHLGRDGEYATCSAGGEQVYGNFALRATGEMKRYFSK